MNTNAIIARLSSKRKGQFFKASYITDVPVCASAKAHGDVVLKYTIGTFRWGIDYKNMAKVKAADALKGGNVRHELPFGEWDPQHKGLVINHRGKEYIRLYGSPNKSQVRYYLNGRAIDKEELKAKGIVLPSYWTKKSGNNGVFTLKAGNIQEIF